MFCIHETCCNNKKIIGTIDSLDQFIEVIQEYMNNSYPTMTILENITLSQLQYDNAYDSGIYLVKNMNQIELISKTDTISESYICNLAIVLYKWEILPFENLLPQNQIKISIREIKFDFTKRNPSFLITGKRGCGKSWLIRDIIHKLNSASNDSNFIQNALIINPTERLTPFYSLNLPNAKIMYVYDKNIVLQHIAKGKGCIILDNCLTNSTCVELNDIISNCDIPLIISASCPYWINQKFVKYIDYQIFLKEDSNIFKRKIREAHKNIFPTYICFEKIFTEMTKDFRTMVIDAKKDSTNIEDILFWYKANDIKICNNITSAKEKFVSDKEIKKLLGKYCELPKNFMETLQNYTKDWGCMVLDADKTSSDKIFWYKSSKRNYL